MQIYTPTQAQNTDDKHIKIQMNMDQKCKIKAKWLSEEALQTGEKREVKGKGEKKRYTHFCYSEFQRIARRDKKAFLSDHKES